MANFPTSLDSLSNPTATTKRNDPGFELHTVISTLNDIVELLESKLGITDSPASNSPLASTVLTSLANGKSGWATIITAMLAANAVTQTALAIGSTGSPTTTSTSPVDLTDMTATLTTVGGQLLCLAVVVSSNGTAGSFNEFQFVLDGSSSAGKISQKFTAANDWHVGVIATRYTGVSAASHTVKVQWNATTGTATAQGVQRYLIVVELKR